MAIKGSFYISQGSQGQGKVREKWKNSKAREKSGNFESSQGNLKFWLKSGKSLGVLETEVDRDRRNKVLRGINENMTNWL